MSAYRTWNQQFYQNVRQYASQTAVIDGKQSVTYQELNERSNRLARALRERGISKGNHVAVMMRNSVEAVTTILAVIKAGAAYVPVNPHDAIERKKQITKDSESILMITSKKLDDSDLMAGRKIMYEEVTIQCSALDLEDNVDEEDAAYLLYTSGSTGAPKGAVISHHNLIVQMEAITNHYGFTHEDMWTQFHTICFDFSVLEIFGSLYSGGTMVIVPEALRYDSESFLTFLEEYPITVLGLVPSVMYRIPIERADVSRLSLHTMILGGEKLSFSKLASWFVKMPELRVVNGYGLTETTIFNMGKTITKDMNSLDTSNIGQVFSPNRVYLLHDGVICKTGEVGEICLGGPTISKGYWKNDDLNRERYLAIQEEKDGLVFRTGDVGRLLKNGDIEFIGRVDNQVKIRGYRVEIEEVENRIRFYHAVDHAAVKVSEDGTQLLCFVVLNQGTMKELYEYVKKNLPDYMIPSRFIQMEELPLTDRGKVDKSKLIVEDRAGLMEEYLPCTTPLEKALLELWKEEFPNIRVGAMDSYFELGGNSLSVIVMLDRAGKQYHRELSLYQFMQDPTIQGLSQMVEDASLQEEEEEAVELSVYQDGYPMTDLQQAFFIGRQSEVELGNCASHSYAEIQIPKFDAQKLQNVVERLVERHALLRCWFDDLGNHHIEKSISCCYPIHDLRAISNTDQDKVIKAVRERMENEILDYHQAPLARMEVSQVSDDMAIVHLYIDALLSDGWSHELLLYEADLLYGEEMCVLPPNSFTYGDFVRYEERLKKTKRYQSAKEFWLSKLPQIPGNPMLPVKQGYLSNAKIASEQRRRIILWDSWHRIEHAASLMGVSPFVVSLTAFCKVIAKYSRNQRFVINLPVSNRPPVHEQIDYLFGVCSNFFLFDYENLSDEPLVETAKRVQSQMWLLKEHDSFSGNEIVRQIYRESGNVGGFVASMVFTSLLDIPFPEKRNIRRIYLETHTSQIWMDTVLMSDAEGVSINCDFVKGLLEPSLVEHMMEDWVELLKALAIEERSWMTRTDIGLSDDDKKLFAKNERKVCEYGNDSVISILQKVVQKNPDHLAIATQTTELTYLALMEQVMGIHQQLESLNKGESVAIVMNKSWQQVAAVLAVLAKGGCYVPLDDAFPKETIAYCTELTKVNICLTDHANYEKVHSIPSLEVLDIENVLPVAYVPEHIVPTTAKDRLAVIFTSGTTGKPKGIQLQQQGVLNSVWFTNQHYHVKETDNAIALTNLCHDMSMYDIFGMIAVGGTIVIPERDGARDPKQWSELIQKYQVSIWNSVPAFAEMFFTENMEERRTQIASIRLVIHGGDFLKPSLARNWMDYGQKLELVNVGGPTETSLWSIYHNVTEKDLREGLIPYGKAIANMRHYLLNDLLEPVPVGVIGTIYSEGVGLACEYVGMQELTEEKFIQWKGRRIFNTGDLGYYNTDGEIIICGRDDNQLKINGKRIELEEIENTMNHLFPELSTCVVYQKEKGKLVAYYVGMEDADRSMFQQKLSENLPDYMIPSVYIPLESMPLTRNGKVNRKYLAKQSIESYLSNKNSDTEYQDEEEKELYQEAEKLIGCEHLAKNSNFFMEGGNSILAIRMLAFIKERYQVDMSIGEIFTHPCLEEWYALIDSKKGQKTENQIGKQTIMESHIPLSPAQTGIWFYEQCHSSAKYTICAHIMIHGSLDDNLLEQSIEEIVRKHQVFHLNFNQDKEGVPYQVIQQPQYPVQLERLEVDDQSGIQKVLQEKSQHRFSLSEECLYQFTYVRSKHDGQCLLITMHHLLVDETSLEMLCREIVDHYQMHIKGKNSDDTKKNYDYIQYCLGRKKATPQVLAYWKQIYDAVPISKVRFGSQSAETSLTMEENSLHFTISEEMLKKLGKLCNKKGCTMFGIFYSCYLAALYLYGGESCVVTTTTFTDRTTPEYADSYGMFVYNQCIIYQSDFSDTLETLLDKVNHQICSIYDKPLDSMNDVIRELGLKDDYLKLQQHQVFTYVDDNRVSREVEGTWFEPIQIQKKPEGMDLNLLLERVDSTMCGHLYFAEDYMEGKEAKKLLGLFHDVMEQFTKAPEGYVVDIGYEEEIQTAKELEEELFFH